MATGEPPGDKNKESELRLLFEAHYARVYRTAYFFTRNPSLAEDVTQETFLRAFQSLEQLRDQAKAENWLVAIAANLARNVLRKERRTFAFGSLLEVASSAGEEFLEEEIFAQERRAKLQILIASLPLYYREVIVLRYYAEMGVEEIAAALEISPGTVKSRLNRARSYLARKIEGLSKKET